MKKVFAKDCLAGRVVLVTGATQGLGRAAALCFAAHGATVVLLARSVKVLESVYDQILADGGAEPAAIPLDLLTASETEFNNVALQIEREFEVGRLVQDQDGIKGWVHEATLSRRRGLVVTGPERVLRDEASDTAAPVARLMAGVVGRIRRCEATSNWCEVQIADYHGWLKRDEFWGTSPGETVTP